MTEQDQGRSYVCGCGERYDDYQEWEDHARGEYSTLTSALDDLEVFSNGVRIDFDDPVANGALQWKRWGAYGHATLLLARGLDCDAVVEDDDGGHDCPFEARFIAVETETGEEGHPDIHAFCGHHMNDERIEALEEDADGEINVFDMEDGCEASVGGSIGGSKAVAGDGGVTISFSGEARNPCGDKPFMIVDPAGDHPRPLCRRHARDCWVDRLKDD